MGGFHLAPGLGRGSYGWPLLIGKAEGHPIEIDWLVIVLLLGAAVLEADEEAHRGVFADVAQGRLDACAEVITGEVVKDIFAGAKPTL